MGINVIITTTFAEFPGKPGAASPILPKIEAKSTRGEWSARDRSKRHSTGSSPLEIQHRPKLPHNLHQLSLRADDASDVFICLWRFLAEVG
jgi:hypothetical protein